MTRAVLHTLGKIAKEALDVFRNFLIGDCLQQLIYKFCIRLSRRKSHKGGSTSSRTRPIGTASVSIAIINCAAINACYEVIKSIVNITSILVSPNGIKCVNWHKLLINSNKHAVISKVDLIESYRYAI